MKVALVIGHSKKSQGARNKKAKMSEFIFNENLVYAISEVLYDLNIKYEIVYRSWYKFLPQKVNKTDADFAISFHCNAFNKSATGTETLYYERSVKGKALASLLQTQIVGALGLSDRGTKPKKTTDRGGFLLRYTKMPCVIAEPFFIDNDRDLAVSNKRFISLVTAYVETIKSLNSLT